MGVVVSFSAGEIASSLLLGGFDYQDARLGRMDARLDRMDEQMKDLEEQVEALTVPIQSTNRKVDALVIELAELKGGLDVLLHCTSS